VWLVFSDQNASKTRDLGVKIKSSIVIAAAAGSTLAPNAEAIAQPRNTPNAVASPVYTWTGFYIGGHLGAAWQKGETNGAYFDGGTQFPFYNATSHTGFMGGGQIGYKSSQASWFTALRPTSRRSPVAAEPSANRPSPPAAGSR
jgi:hypothetical protein